MKNIFKHFGFFLVAGLVFVSCDYDETNYDSLINEVDPNAPFYVQFANASKSLNSTVDLEGEIEDIETTIDVVLLGVPRSEDIVVDLEVDPSSTIDSNMYELSSTSITIPAGETSGSVSLVTNTEEMPIGETVRLVMNIDAGANSATAGTELVYDLMRIDFCPLENGATDLVGTYSVTDNVDGFQNPFTVAETEDGLTISGIGQDFISGFWAEQVTGGGTVEMEVTGNGNVTIPRQYLFTTVYDGASYDYEIEGSGTWTNCGDKPTLELNYDIYYPGEADGLAKTYSSYLPVSYLGGIFTQN